MSQVRGPNSALTEFLRSQGISAAAIRERHLRRTRLRRNEEAEEEGQDQETDLPDDAEVEENNQPVDSDAEVERIIRAGRRKRRYGIDDENDLTNANGLDDFSNDENIKFCAKCNIRFIVTVYTKQTDDGYLCQACSQGVRRPRADRELKKQRKRVAAALLDKRDYSIPSLQEFCIRTIGKYIDHVEALGYIGNSNLERISRIVTRNRKLNPATLKLFLDPQAKSLEFGDCSELTSQSYDLIPAVCPQLENLTLTMCGQLTVDNLAYMASNLPNLTGCHLDGPFLVRKDAWISFFEKVGPRLRHLTLKSTHRIDSEVIANLVENCPNLESLVLSRLPGVIGADGEAALHMLASLNKLTSLELSYLGDDFNLIIESPNPHPLVVTDDAIITILLSVGSQLQSLILDGSMGLTDKTILQGLRTSCGQLSTLSLTLLVQISDEAVESLFDHWRTKSRVGLESVSLKRCIGLGDNSIMSLLDHSWETLIQLDINSLPMITAESIENITKCVNLTSLDVGFVRCVNDKFINQVSEACSFLNLIEVFGDPHVTAACRIRPGCRLIGRQAD